MMVDTPTNSPDKVIRKLRKKLRQIDHLKVLERELNEEEIQKVKQKFSIRKQLQDLLKQHHPDEIEIMKRPGSILPQSKSDAKKVKQPNSPDSCLTTSNMAPQTETDVSTDNLQLDPPQMDCSPPQTLGQDKSKTEAKPGTSRKNINEPRGDETHTGKCIWRDGCFELLTLQGHNDLILAVDCLDDYILSASRDTTIRVWQVGRTEEERSLRGHTASVTGVSFLPRTLTATVLAKLETDSEEFASQQERVSNDCRILAVSGGLDCMLKIWDVISGGNLSSIYTYNGITSLGCESWGVVTGTEGGRLEFWCLASHQRITFVDAFESQVTTVDVNKHDVYAGSWKGELGVWQLDPARKTLATKYIMERESVPRLSLRQLSAVVQHKGKYYLGDGGPNIKVLDWKKRQMSRLKNHRGDVGMSDSLVVTPDGFLLAASFLVDSGCPSINIRDLESGQYVSSLIDQDEGRYLTLCAGSNVVIAGGHLLKVWIHKERSIPRKNKITTHTSEVVFPVFFHNLTTSAADSGSEEDTDWAYSTEEEEGSQQLLSSMKKIQGEGDSQWWCSIL